MEPAELSEIATERVVLRFAEAAASATIPIGQVCMKMNEL